MPLTPEEQQELAQYEQMEREQNARMGLAPNEEPESIMTPLKQEMHPSFSTFERTILKNLSNDPEASVKYLKERHPELEIKHQGGQIIARTRGTQEDYRVLDPQTGFDPTSLEGLKEAGRDVLDIGYDVPAGLVQGVAGTAGAAAGGLATAPAGGWGAIPGAAAASGAAGAGLETVRQGLGKLAGIPQDISGKDIALSGAIGAVMPGVAGGGLTKAGLQSVAKGAGKELTEEALQNILKSQRGVIGRGMDFAGGKLLPAYGEMAGGIPKETTQTLRQNLPKIQEMERAGVTEAVEDVHGRLVGNLASLKSDVGKELERAITESGKTVDASKIKAPLQKAIEQAKTDALELNNKMTIERVDELQQIYDDLFKSGGKNGKEIPDQISAKAAFNLQDQLADISELWRTGQGPQARFKSGATRGEKKTSEVIRKAYNVVNEELDVATEGLSPQLKAKYREYAQIQKDLQPFFKTPEKTFETLSTLQKKDRKFLMEKLSNLEKNHGIPLADDAKVLEAFRAYSRPALLGQSGLGSTSTSRTVPLSLLGGTVGSLAGYKAGGGYAGAALGGLAGAKLGSYMGSPDMIRRMVQLEQAAQRGAQKAAPVAHPTLFGGGRSAWQALQEQDE